MNEYKAFSKRPKNKEFENARFLVTKFCRDPKTVSWPAEIKMAKKLLKIYPSLDFWKFHVELEKPVNSLSFFLCEDGKKVLKDFDYMIKLELPEKKEYDLNSDFVAERVYIENNEPKTVREFLRK